MDFYVIKHKSPRKGVIEIYPDFIVGKSNDLMIRSKSFYAIWDDEKRTWSKDEYDVARLVDKELVEYGKKLQEESNEDLRIHIKILSDFGSNTWTRYRTYLSQSPDNSHTLDSKLTFQNTSVRKNDYVSKRLLYSLEEGNCLAYTELMEKLYSKEEQQKLEWAIGSVIAGDSKEIQKFIVLFGAGGTGKSTFLNILQQLFAGYFTVFEAKELTSSNNSFATEVFKDNPLVAIQHDGDLSKIETNTLLNSIISHEYISMNEKYKPKYQAKLNCLLFMATNKPVMITDAKSGIIRRLIDVHPTGKTFIPSKYQALMTQIQFELGAIAYHCLEVYKEMGKNYYSSYKPLDMIERTDVFYNFVEQNYYTFKEQSGTTLVQAWALYKDFCEDSSLPFKMPKHRFKAELANYFESFEKDIWLNGEHLRNFYKNILEDKFKMLEAVKEDPSPGWLNLDSTESIFDKIAQDYPAQYAELTHEIPAKPWSKVKTKLSSLNTKNLHYVQIPENHIVIDFDIRDENGNKNLILNLEEARKWTPTYAEFSKSGAGIHLHYIWTGDVKELNNKYDEGIEIKVFTGNSALRRKLSYCNNLPIATINTGLPLKEKKMINFDVVKSEQALRNLILRNIKKEIHPGTKPSIDFIYKILEDAYNSGLSYDVRDMRQKVLNFAINSTNQAQYCIKLVNKMKFNSDEPSINTIGIYTDERLVFFDVEVFPNLLIVNWKYQGPESKIVHMINPGSQEIERLFQFKLIGFNNRRYDNHILYGRFIGYDNEKLFLLSNAIIDGSNKALFGEAFNISFADVYDFSTKKQSLKKFQLELGLFHKELPYAWDQPLPEDKWPEAISYCDNDVISTEAVFNDRQQDFVARQILADISGLSVNDTTQAHTAKIIFGNNPNPQQEFVYTNLSELFPGYVFESGKSSYRNEDPGEGGYVYSEPGYYENVTLLDVASMHPTSIKMLNLFGPYTKKYVDIMEARLAIKHKDFDKARKMFNGVLEKYLTSTENADDLAFALKIAINIVYGLTSASFSNKFKDARNIDNIVAKRGSLFMIDLKHAVQEKGFTVIHIKTDSIKIANATPKLIDFIIKFGNKYGYTFEQEAIYDRLCLVNDSVYVARDSKDKKWITVGAEFSHPYIFKSLFSNEPITFEDLREIKTVTTALYLDMNEDIPFIPTKEEDKHNYIFVGKAGAFYPIKQGFGGGLLVREKDGKFYSASGAKGYRWLEAETLKHLDWEDYIDYSYYDKLVNSAIEHIQKYIDFESFIKD